MVLVAKYSTIMVQFPVQARRFGKPCVFLLQEPTNDDVRENGGKTSLRSYFRRHELSGAKRVSVVCALALPRHAENSPCPR